MGGSHTNPREQNWNQSLFKKYKTSLAMMQLCKLPRTHVDLSDILMGNNSTHFIWKYWISATDCVFNEMSFRTFL